MVEVPAEDRQRPSLSARVVGEYGLVSGWEEELQVAPGPWLATHRANARDNAGVLCQERTTLVIGLHVKIPNAIARACRQA